MGRESEAIPFYERAIKLGLAGEYLEGALIGLGSSYRCVGERERAVETLRQAQEKFPRTRVIEVFLAMALHNVGQYSEAMRLLMRSLAETSQDESIGRYKKAILFYSDKL